MAAAHDKQGVTDHEWQDLACMALGVLVLLSPWVVPNDDMGVMTLNTVVVGLIVLIVSELELEGHSCARGGDQCRGGRVAYAVAVLARLRRRAAYLAPRTRCAW